MANKRRTSGTVTLESSSVPALFSLLLLTDAGQPSMGHHRQGDIAIPDVVPEADFILIESRFSLGLFNTLLYRVALAYHRYQCCERTLGWSVGEIIGDLFGIAERATCQQPDIMPWKRISTLPSDIR